MAPKDDESFDKLLDELELRISARNLAIVSKFMDLVRSDELKTMLVKAFILSADCVPTLDELRVKSSEYLIINPKQEEVMRHLWSACSIYKQTTKAIGHFFDDVNATDEDQEEYLRGLIMNNGQR